MSEKEAPKDPKPAGKDSSDPPVTPADAIPGTKPKHGYPVAGASTKDAEEE